MGKKFSLNLKLLAVLTALVMVVSCTAVLYSGTEGEKGVSEGGGKGVFSLMPPPFIGVAGAAEATGGGDGAAPRASTTFLEEEAGISAYTDVGETIDLEKAKTAFRTIESETDEYIIGSVPLPDYPETEDVHAYVHKDGWIVTYYLKEEPAAKIANWEDLSSTKLEVGIGVVCDAANIPMKTVKYYDFRYPNAEKLTMIIDYDEFKIKIPGDFVVYSSTYSCDSGKLYIDGDYIGEGCGTIQPSVLKPDEFHTVEGRVAIVLIYRAYVTKHSLIITNNSSNPCDISLEVPLFISTRSIGKTKEAVRAGTTFLEEEAGISAYTNVGETIDLEKAKTAFRTIEYETDEYIIGSVALPDYPETEDVHAYVHKDGWIVTYYLNEEPAAKILDWKYYDTDEVMKGTKLDNGITEVCNAAWVLPGSVKYYDFRYPNANGLMIVADAQWEEGTDTFNLKIPTELTVYERSWSHYARDSDDSTLKLDGNTISSIGSYDYSVTKFGTLTLSQLNPGVFHNVSLWHDEYQGSFYNPARTGEAFGAIALIYREA